MNAIKNFFATHKLSAHSVATAMGALILFYNYDPQFKSVVLAAYAHFPTYAKTAVEIGVSFYAWYKSTRKGTPTQ